MRTTLLLFSGNDTRLMSTLTACRVEYQASRQGKQKCSASAVDDVGMVLLEHGERSYVYGAVIRFSQDIGAMQCDLGDYTSRLLFFE